MFIEFEETPNPNTLKFLPGVQVLSKGTREFKTLEEAAVSPLATRLFSIDGVQGVFFGKDFVSVTRVEGANWEVLKPLVLTLLMEHFSAGLPVVTDEEERSFDVQTDDEDDSEIGRQIRELLDTRVKPAVAMDGGNIEYVRFENGIVYLRMEGACAGCPSSTMTLKHGIEGLLKHFIPEVERVEPEQGEYY